MAKRFWALCAMAVMLVACGESRYPTAKGPIPPPPPWLLYSVYFDTNSSTLNAAGLDTLARAAEAYRVSGATRVIATGHTDTVGDPQANLALSQKRADAVKAALVGLGVPSVNISVTASGENQLPVKTEDNVSEVKNRSVDIQVK